MAIARIRSKRSAKQIIADARKRAAGAPKAAAGAAVTPERKKRTGEGAMGDVMPATSRRADRHRVGS